MRIFLEFLSLPDADREGSWLFQEDEMQKGRLNGVYNTYYPFGIFTKYKNAPEFEFDPVSILYGGNGSGKSTILNIIAEKLKLDRRSPFEQTDFFEDYCNLCELISESIPMTSKIITSDDIFKKLSDVRRINRFNDGKRRETWDRKSEMLYEIGNDPSLLRLDGLDDYARFAEYVDAARKSTSQFINDRIRNNLKAHSNGETALGYLTGEIAENALYLLDEPENSLAPASQLKLKQFIEESARLFGCQFIISTHSPLLLSIEGAKIYDLDDECRLKKWFELENTKVYAEFFLQHKDRFE